MKLLNFISRINAESYDLNLHSKIYIKILNNFYISRYNVESKIKKQVQKKLAIIMTPTKNYDLGRVL